MWKSYPHPTKHKVFCQEQRAFGTIEEMTIEKLRNFHPALVYKSFKTSILDGVLTVTYAYFLEPDIQFLSTYRFPLPMGEDARKAEQLLFQLGIVEAMSYWKLACPPEFVIEAGPISKQTQTFFEDLFLHGLGEFYYVNGIDFTTEQFLTIRAEKTTIPKPVEIETNKTDLVLVGGGKDSALLLSLIAQSSKTIRPMVVNPSNASLDIIKAVGITDPLVITRTLDPKLYELNSNGYLNGHTPFSALLSFIGAAVATQYGYENIVVANEQSANEGNVVYKGVEINHQYSKSLRYENLFRSHLFEELSPSLSYFSAMRPFNDLQISKMFSKESYMLSIFRSCNRSRTTNGWCGACAKCAFTYLTLFPFLPFESMQTIFGSDYFTDKKILMYIRELVGVTAIKPFDCVGTKDEARLALLLSLASYQKNNRRTPEGLLLIKIETGLQDGDVASLLSRVLDHINGSHNVPEEYMTMVMKAFRGEEQRV